MNLKDENIYYSQLGWGSTKTLHVTHPKELLNFKLKILSQRIEDLRTTYQVVWIQKKYA